MSGRKQGRPGRQRFIVPITYLQDGVVTTSSAILLAAVVVAPRPWEEGIE